MKRTFFDKLIDGYLDYPLFWDSIIILMIFICNYFFPLFNFKFLNTSDSASYLSNLISADVSLVGFILAALTIIVTFRSNIKAKGLDDTNNALELILSSKHYPSIVRVFKISIIELLLLVIVNYSFWLIISNLSVKLINVILICATFATISSLLRTLYILFFALTMEEFKKN